MEMTDASDRYLKDKPRNLKEWEDKYRYFSHTAQDRRTKQQCQFFPDLKSKETYSRYLSGQAKPLNTSGTATSAAEVHDREHYNYDKVMARMKEYLEYSRVVSPEFDKPVYSKYKYFSGGGVDHIERQRKGPDQFMEWKKKMRPQTAPTMDQSVTGFRDDGDSFVSLSKDFVV